MTARETDIDRMRMRLNEIEANAGPLRLGDRNWLVAARRVSLNEVEALRRDLAIAKAVQP